MSDSQGSPLYASSPFDHEKADAILRSSDNIDFRVFKLFLSLASPFFETLFDLPQPSVEMSTGVEVKDGLPVIPISEDSKMLDLLLRFCYPCTLAEDPTLEDFRDAVNVFEVAKKYCLDAVERTICKSLFSPKMLKTNSLRCFAIACRARMQDECALAAKYTLREPLIPTCIKNAATPSRNWRWISPGSQPRTLSGLPPHGWWVGMPKATVDVLGPCPEDIL